METTGEIENELQFSSIPRVSLHVRNLVITASKTAKVLVNDFSIDLPSGSVMAIMGGSGSGKTTLLNVLASKIRGGLEYGGTIKYVLENNDENGVDKDVVMAYLPQQDILSARLTCRETLLFAADLKLKASSEEKARLVDQLIDELGLKDCADTLVGDNSHRGLSGGEKRRLSIGTQMIANPSIMFLDEPTTGLDAYSAFLVVRTLKKIAAQGGRTFILSIHQPRSDILFLFDHISILSRGNIVYCDRMQNIIPYFESIGYQVPDLVNPADYFIDLSSVDSRDDKSEKLTQERLHSLIEKWQAYSSTNIHLLDISGTKELHVKKLAAKVGFKEQVLILTRRNFKLNLNDYVTLLSTILEPIVMGTITGWIFYKPNKTTISGLRSISASLYSSIILQSYLYLLFDTYRLCEQDIALYDRERSEGTITPLSFMVARKLSLFISDDLMMTLIFTSITYFMFGLEASANKFFLQFAVIFLIQLSSSGLSMLSVAVSRDFSKASLVGNLSYTLLSLGSGFFVNSKDTPVYVRWTKYISFSWYGFGALMSNAFTNEGCSSDDLDQCLGNEILDTYGFPRNWITLPCAILLCWSIGYAFAALIMFYIKKVDISLQGEIKTKDKKKKKKKKKKKTSNNLNAESIYSSDGEDLEKNSSENSEIPVTLRNIDLRVKYTKINPKFWKDGLIHKEEKHILQSVNAVFKPGIVNAIMGPSGSGKSSLLNLISGRLTSSVLTKFDISGELMFNDSRVSRNMFKSVCSYVSQDDDHLLSRLTVKETLTFAADLRLSELTSEQRKDRVKDLIRALGLNHCQNTIVGNEFVKGISGGEKRRVSMGIQLLSDPAILLLDEPTSGLDSFTSATILEILERLCTEYGKTVIITIHQPRSKLFKTFGNVLLLAKSGRTAFNGSPEEMISYFSKKGYECPSFTNVADYFLDLISVNTQNEHNEKFSRARVEDILDSWKQEASTQDSSEKEYISEGIFEVRYGGSVRKPCPIYTAYLVNVRRQFTTTRRNIDSLMARIAQIPGLGVIFALFWAPIKHNYTSINNRLGLAQESTALYFVGMLGNLACYPAERDYFYEEFHDNVYSVTPFFLAYMTLELPLTLLASFMYAVFTVLVCGLPRNAGNFFATGYCSFVIATCGESLGIMTNTFFERPGFVVNCISIILSIGTQMSGLLSLHLAPILKGFDYLNPLSYTSMILINFAFPKDLQLTCHDGGQNADGSCQLPTGQHVLQAYGLVVDTQKYLGIIICVAVIYRLLAYLILKCKLDWIKW